MGCFMKKHIKLKGRIKTYLNFTIYLGIVLCVVAITTVMTKLKTQRGAEELRIKSSLIFANVVRGGIPQRISGIDVVVGDIVKIQAGETICADGYLVDGNISVNNAILNGLTIFI